MIIYKLTVFDPEDPEKSNIVEFFMEKKFIKQYFIDNDITLIEDEDYEIDEVLVREK